MGRVGGVGERREGTGLCQAPVSTLCIRHKAWACHAYPPRPAPILLQSFNGSLQY